MLHPQMVFISCIKLSSKVPDLQLSSVIVVGFQHIKIGLNMRHILLYHTMAEKSRT